MYNICPCYNTAWHLWVPLLWPPCSWIMEKIWMSLDRLLIRHITIKNASLCNKSRWHIWTAWSSPAHVHVHLWQTLSQVAITVHLGSPGGGRNIRINVCTKKTIRRWISKTWSKRMQMCNTPKTIKRPLQMEAVSNNVNQRTPNYRGYGPDSFHLFVFYCAPYSVEAIPTFRNEIFFCLCSISKEWNLFHLFDFLLSVCRRSYSPNREDQQAHRTLIQLIKSLISTFCASAFLSLTLFSLHSLRNISLLAQRSTVQAMSLHREPLFHFRFSILLFSSPFDTWGPGNGIERCMMFFGASSYSHKVALVLVMNERGERPVSNVQSSVALLGRAGREVWTLSRSWRWFREGKNFIQHMRRVFLKMKAETLLSNVHGFFFMLLPPIEVDQYVYEWLLCTI